MAIEIEDGTGKANAEAYISVADADAYLYARGNLTWSDLAEQAREAALRVACDYMEAAYGPRWAGDRATDTQALSWPRTGREGVPVAVQRANADLAVRAAAGPLLADQGAQVKSETVGPLSVTYADGARQSVRYAAVDAMLAALLRPAGMIPVRRA